MCEISTHAVPESAPAHPLLVEVPVTHNQAAFRCTLDSQRELIHRQLEELQRVAILQCQITGTNPLSQEMEAAVLGTNMGKRYGETLMPKALKCLYNVFSIKDTITKKEAREMSALSGATVTQVREFFSGQRSRVRKFVHLSHGVRNCDASNFIPASQISVVKSGLQETEGAGCTQDYAWLLDVVQGKIGGGSRELSATERAEKLLNAMRKENNFFGQTLVTDSILQAQGSVLRCFVNRGGLQLIIKWLMQAALEEQTSLIRLLLKTLTIMPLGSTLPRQMSSLLQTVNKLRFYRAQDVASCARLLLSRWSKFLKNPQIGKVSDSTGPRMLQSSHKRSRDDVNLHVEGDVLMKKKSKSGILAGSNQLTSDAPSTSLEKSVRPRDERANVPEIQSLTRKQMGSIKLHGDCVKQKRKVQLVEEARASSRRRDVDGGRVSNFESTSRPLSADDIKKAKRRAHLLNSTKVHRALHNSSQNSIQSDLGTSTVSCCDQQNEATCTVQEQSLEGLSGLSGISGVSGSDVKTALREVSMKNAILNKETFPGSNAGYLKTEQGSDSPSFQRVNTFSSNLMQLERSTAKHCTEEAGIESQMQWVEPQRMYLDSGWSVASGEESSEIHTQSLRLSNEQEVLYVSLNCIPPNPEEPAERFCLFVDDASVPEILLEAVDDESLEKEGTRQSPNDELTSQEADSNRLHKISISADVHAASISVESSVHDPMLKIADKQSLMPQMSGKLNYVEPTVQSNGAATQSGEDVRQVPLSHHSQYVDQCRGTSVNVGNSIQGREQAAMGSGYESLITKTESLIRTLGSKGESIVSQRESSFFNNVSTNFLGGVPQPADFSLRSSDPTSLNVSQLSPEACAEMLKVVLRQLADNSKGFGADLGLLSVFLKNPELVQLLMSSQNDSVGNLLSKTSAAKVDSNTSNMCNMEIEIAKLIARVMPNETTSTEGQYVPIEAALKQQVGDLYTRKHELSGSQIKPTVSQRLPISQETQSIAHQVGLLQVESTKLSQDGLNFTGQNQIESYEHTVKIGDAAAGLASSTNWVLPRVAGDPVHSTSYHDSHLPSSSQLLSRGSPSVVSPAVQRGQPLYSIRSMNQAGLIVKKQDITMNRRPEVSSTELPDQSLVKARDSRMPSGILLPVPEIPRLNHQVDHAMLMHSMNTQQSLIGGSVPSRIVGSTYLNYEHKYSDQFRPSEVIGSCMPSIQPPVLHGRSSSFATNSVRPSMMWKSPQSQINRGRHNRLG